MHSCEYTVFVPKVKILDHAGTPLTATAVPSKVSLWDSVDRIQRTWQVDLSSPAQYFVIVSSQYDGVSWVPSSLASSQYSSASTTIFQSADGYGAGDLQSVSVDTDGVITGQYSNGQVIPLYRVALAKFQNNDGLFKAGGNLYRETRLSGDPITGKPGSNGTGNISANSLEQSNIDIANEFVKMITTQRGFQANSKIITVTDQMLAELINLKR